MWDARSLAFALLWSLLPAAAAAAALDLVDEGEKLGLRLRPRKANLDLLLGGVTGSGARCGGCGGTGSGGGGGRSELVFGSCLPRRKSEMSDVLERTRPEGERAGGIVVVVDVYV